MKLLLTSGGVTNTSINAMPLVTCSASRSPTPSALCIPGNGGHPRCTPASAWRFIAGNRRRAHVRPGLEVGGVLELTALPSIGEERWMPWVREADVLLADGGDATYLCHWMRRPGWRTCCLRCARRSGWSERRELVMTPRIGSASSNAGHRRATRTLGMVGFSIFPHLDALAGEHPGRCGAVGRRVADPAYAIDKQTPSRSTTAPRGRLRGRWTKFGA